MPCRAGSSAVRFRAALATPRLQGCDLRWPSFLVASFLCQSLRFRWLLSVCMGPFYGMVRVHLAQLVEHALRMRMAMGSIPGGGFPCLARFGPQHFLAFLVRTAPVSLRSMVSPARGMSCLRFGLRFASELSSSAERATRRAGSMRIAWLGCARGAACLLDCLTALVLLYRFGTAVLLPRAKVPALGRRRRFRRRSTSSSAGPQDQTQLGPFHVGCSSEQIRKGRKERPAGGPGVPDIKKS